MRTMFYLLGFKTIPSACQWLTGSRQCTILCHNSPEWKVIVIQLSMLNNVHKSIFEILPLTDVSGFVGQLKDGIAQMIRFNWILFLLCIKNKIKFHKRDNLYLFFFFSLTRWLKAAGTHGAAFSTTLKTSRKLWNIVWIDLTGLWKKIKINIGIPPSMKYWCVCLPCSLLPTLPTVPTWRT